MSPLSGPGSCGEPPPGARAQPRAVRAPRDPELPARFSRLARAQLGSTVGSAPRARQTVARLHLDSFNPREQC